MEETHLRAIQVESDQKNLEAPTERTKSHSVLDEAMHFFPASIFITWDASL